MRPAPHTAEDATPGELRAGVVLAAHRTRYDRFGDDLRRRPADDPQSGGIGR